jgi:hypothetical protein
VQVPAVIFDRLAPDQAVEMFVTINAKHTKLNPSHLISLAGRRLYPDKTSPRATTSSARSPRTRARRCTARSSCSGVGRAGSRRRRSPRSSATSSPSVQALGGRDADRFLDHAKRFFLNYFKQTAHVFEKAWHGRKYSIKTGMALALSCASCPTSSRPSKPTVATLPTPTPSAKVIGTVGREHRRRRFETEGEWRQKLAGGTSSTVDQLARELRGALKR